MTDRDMKRLEGAIGRALPSAVRDFFLTFPPALHGIEEDPDNGDFIPTDDPDVLISMNLPGTDGLQPADREPHVFILGAGGRGETFWVNLNTERGTVHRFEAGQTAESSNDVADSIAEFARQFTPACE